jgi:NitT/TauT family transport system ATP-binding protein
MTPDMVALEARTSHKPTSSPPHIGISGLTKVFESQSGDVIALEAIDLSIRHGEFVSLLGPSGCGKSTLLKIIAGLENASRGQVQLSGKPLTGVPDRLGMVFQRDVLLDWRTILDNVLLPVELADLRRADYESRARKLLNLFGLAGCEGRRPWELSGGMRQRAAICRALLIEPELLLMDEPFGALDALTRDELNIELQRMWITSNKTVLFVTHSIPEAILLSDRIVVMASRPGRVVEIIKIEFPRPRELMLREEAAFATYSRRIRTIFEEHGILHTAQRS